MIDSQWTVVAPVVVVSACYAAWTLFPASLRKSVAALALRLPLPTSIAAKLRTIAASTSGCGCSGCDRRPAAADARAAAQAPAGGTTGGVVAQPITLHRRLPR